MNDPRASPVARRLEDAMTRDLALGCVLLVIAAAYYLGAAAIPGSDLSDAVGPAGLPRVYAILLAALALVLMARAIRARPVLPAAAVPERTDRPPRTLGGLAVLLTIGVFYIAVVPLAGYPITIAALMIATAFYQAGRASGATRRSGPHTTAQILLVGVAGGGLLWIVFVVLLRIPQPAGVWSRPW